MVKFLHSGDPDGMGMSSHVKNTFYNSAYIQCSQCVKVRHALGGAMHMSHVDVRIVIYKLFKVQDAGVRILADSCQSRELYCRREWREPSSSSSIKYSFHFRNVTECYVCNHRNCCDAILAFILRNWSKWLTKMETVPSASTNSFGSWPGDNIVLAVIEEGQCEC